MSNLKKRGRYRRFALKALETSKLARDDDWIYLFNFLYHSLRIKIPKDIRNEIRSSGFSLSTILRERQKIQNDEGLFPPSPEIVSKRKKKQREYSVIYKK